MGKTESMTYCILLGKELWTRWIATSQKFGFSDLETSRDQSTSFVKLLLDIADASPIVANIPPGNVKDEPSGTTTLEHGETWNSQANQQSAADQNEESEGEYKVPSDDSDDDYATNKSARRKSKRTKKRKRDGPNFDTNDIPILQLPDNYMESADPISFLCPVCEVMFKNRRELRQHMKKKHPESEIPPPPRKLKPRKLHTCQVCKKSYKKRAYLEDHMQVMHLNISIPCDVCGKVFKSKQRVQQHWWFSHRPMDPDKRNTHVCEQCGKEYKCSQALKSHKESVHEGKRYECEHCGKSYTARHILNQHIAVTHERNQELLCSICGNVFYHRSRLVKHMREHREACMPCHICGKRFQGNRRLENHMKTHTNEKKYECAICDKHFKWRVHLQRHLRTVHKQTISIEEIKPVTDDEKSAKKMLLVELKEEQHDTNGVTLNPITGEVEPVQQQHQQQQQMVQQQQQPQQNGPAQSPPPQGATLIPTHLQQAVHQQQVLAAQTPPPQQQQQQQQQPQHATMMLPTYAAPAQLQGQIAATQIHMPTYVQQVAPQPHHMVSVSHVPSPPPHAPHITHMTSTTHQGFDYMTQLRYQPTAATIATHYPTQPQSPQGHVIDARTHHNEGQQQGQSPPS